MKKTIFSTMIASLLIFVGCQNEELVNESTDNSNGKKVTLTAHIAGSADSRVTLSENTMYDDELDKNVTKILVGWKNSGEEFTMYDQYDNSALFEQVEGNKFECVNFELDGGGQYTAYYGYVNRTYSHLSSQNGRLDESKVLMKAVVNDLSEIEFEHKTAIVKFTFNGISNGAEIDEIVMEGVTTLSEGNKIVVEPEEQNNIYVFIPTEYNGNDGDADYDNGYIFNFTVTDSNDKKYTGSLSIKQDIEAGKRYTATIVLTEVVMPVAIDLGLSVKWASLNVGATSPEEYGNYFVWGDTQPKSGSNSYVTYGKNVDDLQSSGIIDAEYNLTAAYDAATANLGNGWRMPTYVEMQELIDGCNWQVTTQSGKNGFLGVSKQNGNEIFLPAGSYNDWNYGLSDQGSYAFYWTSTASNGNTQSTSLYYAYYSMTVPTEYGFDRRHALMVRPVKE